MPAVIDTPKGFYYDDITERPMFNGERVLGITDVLKLSGIMDGQMFGTEYHLWCGQARHKAIELWVKGTLNISTLDPAIVPSVEAFLDFQQKTGFKPTASEKKMYSAVYRVATRIDLLGEFPDGAQAIVELKSGTVAKPTAIQTAGQDWIMGATHTRRRYGLSVPESGKPVVVPYEDRDDYSIWVSAMNIAHWKIRKLGAKF